MSYSTRFQVSYNPVEQVHPLVDDCLRKEKILSQIPSELEAYKKHHCTEVLHESKFPAKGKLTSGGFVKTVVDCHSFQQNLVIRPDDVWTAIMVQFSCHINKCEKYRKKFVNHNGKNELVIKKGGGETYGNFVQEIVEEIDKNLVNQKVKDWILPSFSTTAEDDRIVCGVMFMAAKMNKDFEYACGLVCGIPHVTLEGTLSDWIDIEGRLKKLKKYKLGWWYKMLEPVLEQFIKAKRGIPHIDFWQRICYHIIPGGGPRYLSGWITVFCVFDSHGNRPVLKDQNLQVGPWPVIEDQNIATGFVEVEVSSMDDNKDTIYHATMFAGHMAQAVEADGTTLRPISGWVICLKPNPEDQKRLDEDEGNGSE